jgi:hypothetical protein
MNQQQRANAVMLALLAAVVVKPIEQATGVTLTQDDLLALVVSLPTAWHFTATAIEGLIAYIERLQAARQPSIDTVVAHVLAELHKQQQATPVPTQPAQPAQPGATKP